MRTCPKTDHSYSNSLVLVLYSPPRTSAAGLSSSPSCYCYYYCYYSVRHGSSHSSSSKYEPPRLFLQLLFDRTYNFHISFFFLSYPGLHAPLNALPRTSLFNPEQSLIAAFSLSVPYSPAPLAYIFLLRGTYHTSPPPACLSLITSMSMSTSSGTSRTTSLDGFLMAEKSRKLSQDISPASDSTQSFYEAEQIDVVPAKGEGQFGGDDAVQEREKIEDIEIGPRKEEEQNPQPALTWPDGGWNAWGNIAGCTLISLTAFGSSNRGMFTLDFQRPDALTGEDLLPNIPIPGDRLRPRSCSSLVIPAHWFRAKRAAAVGIVVAGSSLGGIIFPIMLSNLFDSIGFAWAVRAMALLMFVVQAISIPLIKERLPPLKNKKYFDFGALKEIPFLLHCLSGFFSAFGIFTPYWYIQLFMQSRGSSTSLSFYSIAIMNAAGMVGRVTSGYFGDAFGRFNTLVPLASLQAVAVFAIWTTSMHVPQTIVFAIIFGFASASYLSVASSCVAQITKDQSRIGTRTGMFMAAMAPGKEIYFPSLLLTTSFLSAPSTPCILALLTSHAKLNSRHIASMLLGILAGPPIAGALLSLRSNQSLSASGGGANDFRYLWAQFFGASLLSVGAFFAFATRVACSRKLLTKAICGGVSLHLPPSPFPPRRRTRLRVRTRIGYDTNPGLDTDSDADADADTDAE
ncbi:MFS general substrate transporter [Sanghuangporus baumii]|uniref:MFS general substrate transporter n=1 Tax=Sanghuangporus baumii TaxID=108892 RepID=A0A9Q5HU57_SANBA|nr:MFS general substrate transporter [Sanghuangporus baumii]